MLVWPGVGRNGVEPHPRGPTYRTQFNELSAEAMAFIFFSLSHFTFYLASVEVRVYLLQLHPLAAPAASSVAVYGNCRHRRMHIS